MQYVLMGDTVGSSMWETIEKFSTGNYGNNSTIIQKLDFVTGMEKTHSDACPIENVYLFIFYFWNSWFQ